MSSYPSRRAFVVLVLVLAGLFAFAGVALAQDEGTVIGEGFNGPMGVLVDPSGDVWVIDSGLGGDEPVVVANPESGELLTATYGLSSHVARISMADGSITNVATLASVGVPGAESSGGSRLALLDGVLYATVGDWHSMAQTDTTPPDGIAVIDRIDADGTVTEVFAGWPQERDENPDGRLYNTHPYGLMGGADGKLWVADAASNSVYAVDPATGEVSNLVVIDPLPGVFPRPDYGGEMLTDAVPTSVESRDGTHYVSLLSGVPFAPGNARVLAIDADGTVSEYATGLTMLMQVRLGPDDELYAVSFGMFGQEGPVPNSGALLRIKEGDASEVVVSGLSFPSSIDFDADGNAYVTINAVGAPGSGQVVRYDSITEAKGTPYAEVLAAAMAAMAPPAESSAAVTETAAMTGTEAAPAEAAPAEAAPSEAAPSEAAPSEAAASEAAATEAPAPETLPVTGGSNMPGLGFLIGALILVVVAGAALYSRRRVA